MADKPVLQVRFYPVEAAIWRNLTKEGKAFYSATFFRLYRDEKGDYKHADSYGGSDLLLLAKVADIVHSKMDELRRADATAEPEENTAEAVE
jgi:hypothetical protein